MEGKGELDFIIQSDCVKQKNTKQVASRESTDLLTCVQNTSFV